MESNDFRNFVDLRQAFNSVDYVKPYSVFNIAGNKYRLISVVNYDLASAVIKHVLTHSDYDKGKWRTL